MKLITDPGPLNFFPDPSDVFQDDLEMHSKYFFPLLSFDASKIDPSLDHPLHFVTPVEPYDGYVGELDAKFHTDYCKPNWIGFDVSHGKYKFQADPRFFDEKRIAEDPNVLKGKFPNHPPYEQQYPISLVEYLAKARNAYADFKADYQSGARVERFENWQDHMHLGSYPEEANWGQCSAVDVIFETIVIPMEHMLARWGGTPEDHSNPNSVSYPTTKNGRKFIYLGAINARLFRYKFMAWDTILLFYDPVDKVALTTFDFT